MSGVDYIVRRWDADRNLINESRFINSQVAVKTAWRWCYLAPVGARAAVYNSVDPLAFAAWKNVERRSGKIATVQDYNPEKNI